MAIHHYRHVLRKDKKFVILIAFLVVLAILAIVIAGQCSFFGCSGLEDPSLINQSPIR